MSARVTLSTVLPSVFWTAVPFLDPRRWFGTLFALAGVALSIVAVILPSPVIRHVSRPQNALPPDRPFRTSPPHRPLRASSSDCSLHTSSPRTTPQSTYPSYVQPSIASTFVTRRSGRRPHTAGEIPLSPHVTFQFGPSPRFVPTGSILASSTLSRRPESRPPLDISLLPAQSDIEVSHDPSMSGSSDSKPISFSPSLSTSMLPITLHNHPAALRSLDCLDLATPELCLATSDQKLPQHSKRPFRLPKLGFKKRGTSIDLPVATKESAFLLPQPREIEKLKDNRAADGSRTSSVKRSNTTMSNCSAQTQGTCMPRRRFSLFSREGHVSRNKGKDKESVTSSSLSQTASPDLTAPVSALPSTDPLKSMNSALDSSADARSSVPQRSSSLRRSSLPPNTLTKTPRAKPARTDPYKTYGVPVPGSERARAFLKAEKELRAEREKRMQRNGADDVQSGRSENEKCKEPAVGDVDGKVDVRAKGDVSVPEAHDGADEFGILVGPSSPIERTSPLGRPRNRLLSMGSDCPQAQEQEASKTWSEKRRKRKDKDASRRTSALTFGGIRGSNVKNRGYASDTGVPSLAYK